jgi:effector-binding domain-containing protein
VDAAELRGMLRLRRGQLQAQLLADEARLSGVEARLRSIEREGRMSVDVVVKKIDPARVAELTARADDTEHIGPVIQPLYGQLMASLGQAGVTPTGPGLAHYEDNEDGSITVHAGVIVATSTGGGDFDVVDVPGVDEAATLVHQGSMDGLGDAWQRLGTWIEENGYRPEGSAREVYLAFDEDHPDQAVTELQWPVARV